MSNCENQNAACHVLIKFELNISLVVRYRRDVILGFSRHAVRPCHSDAQCTHTESAFARPVR